jgi:hypothetical protein
MRALLILTTLVCIWLGNHVYQAKQQRRTVAMIRELDGHVQYDYEMNELGIPVSETGVVPRPPGPAWLRERLGIDFFSGVVSVSVQNVNAHQAQQLHQLRHLPKLRQLVVHECAVDDSFVEQLAGLRHLNEVHLVDTKVTGSGFAHFRGSSPLLRLVLMRSPIEDRSITHLSRFRQLWGLILRDTPVSDACVPAIKQIPGLTSVDVVRTRISPAGRESLKQSLQVLE